MMIEEILRDAIPPGYQALHCTGDGNPLFSCFSTLLFRSKSFSLHLHLATTIHAVDHTNKNGKLFVGIRCA